MITFKQLVTTLQNNSALPISFSLPDSTEIPAHFHITEVGLVEKSFIDCGGTFRSEKKCVLQAWVADDIDHRLHASRLAQIIEISTPVFQKLSQEDTNALEVELEYESDLISQYSLSESHFENGKLIFSLATKHTDCLAKEKCNIPTETETEGACCSGSNCC